MDEIRVEQSDNRKIKLPKEHSDQLIAILPDEYQLCYQCKKCSAGCPVADTTDLPIDQIMGWLIAGDIEMALRSSHIWICIGCHACSAKCPNQADPGRILDFLRVMALDMGIQPPSKVKAFHNAFLKGIKKSGRSSEVLLMSRFGMKQGISIDDMIKGYNLFIKGRLKPFGSKTKDKKSVKKIFDLEDGKEESS